MNFNNLSKLFRYVNSNGDSITFDYAGGFLINKPSGIDTLSINLSQAQGINQVGATIQSTNIQPRPVTITGYLVGDAQTVNKDKLLSVVRPDIGGKLFADGYYLDVYPTATPVIEPKRQLAQFQLSLLAAYPYWCKDDSTSAVLTGIQKLFKLPCNFSKTYRFGQLMKTQFVNVPNRGQVPAPFTVTFTAKGAVTNPKITNATTGKFLVINKALAAGETLVVDITHERTYVTSSVDGDCRGALSLSSNLFRLDVGDNVLKPEAASGLDDLQVSINFAPEIVGVTL
nr:MAG TPA: tail protein [Caudoviricetes sp.]